MTEPSEGARRAAQALFDQRWIERPMSTDNVNSLVRAIDRETHSAEMRKALEHMEGLFFQPYFSGRDSDGKPASQGVCAKCHHFIPSYSEVRNPEYHTADCEFLAALTMTALLEGGPAAKEEKMGGDNLLNPKVLENLNEAIKGAPAQATREQLACRDCREPVIGSVHVVLVSGARMCFKCFNAMGNPPVIGGPAGTSKLLGGK